MNDFIVVLILAIAQGITEWIPVSSSGHLVLLSHFLNYEMSLQLVVALHFGTLMAIFVYFGGDIVDIIRDVFSFNFKSENGRLGLYLIIASIPTGIAGFFLHEVFEKSMGNLWMLFFGLIITSLILFIGGFSFVEKKELNWKSALIIGTAQTLSLFRGISRSGATITAGLFFGLSEKEAVKFSFLLSIPIVFGANILLLGNERLSPDLLWASFASFFVGLMMINFSFKYVLSNRRNLRWIAFYVLVLVVALGIYLALN